MKPCYPPHTWALREKVRLAEPGDTVIVGGNSDFQYAMYCHQILCPTKVIYLRWVSVSGRIISGVELGCIDSVAV